MKTITKNIPKAALVTLIALMLFAACKKNNDESKLKNQSQTASVPSFTNTLLYGNWGNPENPGGSPMGIRYFNLITGAQDSTGTIVYHLTFNSFYNVLIMPKSGYTLKYLNTTKSFASLNSTDYNSATQISPSTGLGLNTTTDSLNTTLNANGWVNYNIGSNVIQYTHNVVMFLKAGTTIYAFRCTAATLEGNSTLSRSKYWFDHGVLVP